MLHPWPWLLWPTPPSELVTELPAWLLWPTPPSELVDGLPGIVVDQDLFCMFPEAAVAGEEKLEVAEMLEPLV